MALTVSNLKTTLFRPKWVTLFFLQIRVCDIVQSKFKTFSGGGGGGGGGGGEGRGDGRWGEGFIFSLKRTGVIISSSD